MRTCYIHLGTHKTGTTAIQKMLCESSDVLRSFGLEYPSIGRGQNSNAHHQLAFAIRNDPETPESDDIIDAFIRDAGTFERDIVLSSEEFINALYFAPERFRRFVEALQKLVDRVVPILYLRSQESYIISNFLERLKYNKNITFEEYALAHIARASDEIPLDYLDVLALAQEISGGHLIARSYDAVRKGGLLLEFQDLLGLKHHLPQNEIRVNVRQPLPELIRLYYENRTGLVASPFEREIIMELVSTMTDEAITLSSSLSRVIRTHFDLSNRYIGEHYGVSLQVDDGGIPENVGAPIDRIFTDRLARLIQTLSRFPERLDSTDAALATAQTLAVDRYQKLTNLEAQLDHVQAALGTAQRLAVDRFQEITCLQGKLNQAESSLRAVQGLASDRSRHIAGLEERLNQVPLALEEAQRLAVDRCKQVADLEERLNQVQSALREAQQLAVDRYQQVAGLEERLNHVQSALGDAQQLAVDRYQQVTDLEQRLNQVQSALGEAQRLAVGRYQQVTDLEERLNQVQSALDEAQRLAVDRFQTIVNLTTN